MHRLALHCFDLWTLTNDKGREKNKVQQKKERNEEEKDEDDEKEDEEEELLINRSPWNSMTSGGYRSFRGQPFSNTSFLFRTNPYNKKKQYR